MEGAHFRVKDREQGSGRPWKHHFESEEVLVAETWSCRISIAGHCFRSGLAFLGVLLSCLSRTPSSGGWLIFLELDGRWLGMILSDRHTALLPFAFRDRCHTFRQFGNGDGNLRDA